MATSSPTFSLINEYVTEVGVPIFHIDLYRLQNEQEAREAGVEDILNSGQLCLVEWPEKAPGIFPEETLHLQLEIRPVSTPTGVVDTRYLCTFTTVNNEPA